jgi:RecB family exonuclease
VDKVRISEPPNPYFVKGDLVHKCAQEYVSGASKTIVKDLVKQRSVLNRLRKVNTHIQVELKWAFTRNFALTQWYAGDAWLRMMIDVLRDQKKPPEVEIIDWKTGKQYDDHKQQRSLYALGGLQLVQIGQLAGGSKDAKLTASHVYTDLPQPAIEVFTMKDLIPLKREWILRIKDMMSDTEYPAKPGFACKYCRFGKSKGGPCQAEAL